MMKFDAKHIADQMQLTNPGMSPSEVSGMWGLYQAALKSGLPDISARETGSYKWGAVGDYLVNAGQEKMTVASFFNELLAYNAGWVEADGRAELGAYRGSISEAINEKVSSLFPNLDENGMKVVKIVGGVALVGVSLYALSLLTKLVRGK